MSYDLRTSKICSKKGYDHLITFESGSNNNQVDLFPHQKKDRPVWKSVKLYVGESWQNIGIDGTRHLH